MVVGSFASARETAFPAEALRAEFPALHQTVHGKPLTYLDNAATSQKPRAVLDAVQSLWERDNANVHRGVHALSARATRRFDGARETVRRFLNARESSEVLFTKGCTEGINLVAACSRFAEGDEILVSTMEHHSNIVPWQLAAERAGAKVIPIPIDDRGVIDLDAYRRLLASGRVRMVGVVYVSNSLGTINPVAGMVRDAHAAGARVLVDAAQAGPHHPIDVQALDADFLTLSCHKIYAPTGVGVLYGKRALLEAFPPYHGGGDMIRTVAFDGTTYAGLPAKFEAGTPNVGGVIGLGAAIEWLELLAPNGEGTAIARAMTAIGAYEASLARGAEALLIEIPGVRIVGQAPEKAGIVSFTIDGVHPHDIGTVLDTEGVAIRAGHHCCMPLMTRLGLPATARASFGLYNTREDVDRLVAAVAKVKEMFA